MTQGKPTDERPSSELIRKVFQLFGVSISRSLRRGRERSQSDGVVHRLTVIGSCSGCRSGAMLVNSRGATRLLEPASTAAPACIHAIRSRDGEVAVTTSEGPVMVFPFVKGTHDRFDRIELEAAELLALIHRGIAASWGATRSRARRSPSHVVREDLLADDELDRFERRASESAVLPIHGDFYGGNLLTAEGRISGVIDWFDAHVAPHEREVSWALWEFCQDDEGEDLLDGEAEAFLRRYLDAAGTAAVAKPFDPCPWIRVRLRAETRGWFSDPRSQNEISNYHARQLVAFERLRGRHLPGR